MLKVHLANDSFVNKWKKVSVLKEDTDALPYTGYRNGNMVIIMFFDREEVYTVDELYEVKEID